MFVPTCVCVDTTATRRCTCVCGYHSHQEVYLSEHGLEEVRVPEPLRDLCTQTEGTVVVPQHVQTVRLGQHNAEGGGKGGGRGKKGKRKKEGKRRNNGQKDKIPVQYSTKIPDLQMCLPPYE